MKDNTFINRTFKRPFWVLMALLCIVFSSATKKLIEQKMAPYFTVSQVLGKKIKDGSKDKRQYLTGTKYTSSQATPDLAGHEFFFLAALMSFALIYFTEAGKRKIELIPQLAVSHNSIALYLQQRKLQI